MPKRRLLSSGAAAEELGIDRSTLWRHVNAGNVVPTEITPGGHYRFDIDDLRRQFRELHEKRRREAEEG